MVIEIYITEQPDGWTFHLSPSECRKIKSVFSYAIPISTIFIKNENNLSFEQLFSNIEHHIKPTLVGIKDSDLQELAVIFKDAMTEKELKIAG